MTKAGWKFSGSRAPTPFKKKVEEQKLDPDTKAPMLDKDGKVITEEKEIEIPMFRPVKVFDVSQTEGKPLPQLASDLTGNVQQFEAFMEALRRYAPVPVSIEPLQENMDGYFSPEKQQIVIPFLSPSQSSPPRTRLEPPEPSSCQTARWTGSPFACPWATRLPRTSGT